MICLRFGENWFDDLTITLNGRARRMFLRSGLDPETWAGKSIRVRGWVKFRHGSMINAGHPEQIEVLAK